MRKKTKLEKYISNQERFVSVLRQIPIDHLENTRKKVQEISNIVEFQAGTKLEVRVRFRGPRFYTNGMHTLKVFANAFDVYVDTKKFPSRSSKRVKKEIAAANRQYVINGIVHQMQWL